MNEVTNEPTNKKQQARDLFFQTELTQTQIAELLDVNRKTIYLWAKEGDWQQAKAAARHMPSILIGQYYAQLGAINQAIQNRVERPYPTREEAEIQRKLTLSIAQTQKRLGTVERVEEMTLFVDHVMKEDQDLARKIMLHASNYIHAGEPGDVVTAILTRHKKDRQEDQAFINNHFTPKQPIDSGSDIPSPLGEGQGGVWDTNEASQTTLKNQANPAPSGDLPADIPKAPMPHPGEQNDETLNNPTQTDNTSRYLGEGQGEASPQPFDELTPWYQHLDNKYNISQDPHVIYRRGVYKITPRSPLWGLGRSLF